MRKSVAVFGSSTADGYFESIGWVQMTKNYLKGISDINLNTSKRFFYHLHNYSNSGENSRQILHILGMMLTETERKYDVVVIDPCLNDSAKNSSTGKYAVSLNKSRQNIAKMREIAKNHGVDGKNLILMGATNVVESKTNPWLEKPEVSFTNFDRKASDQIIYSQAEEGGHTYVGRFDLKNNDFCRDGLHFNDGGHIKIYEKVRPIISSLLDI